MSKSQKTINGNQDSGNGSNWKISLIAGIVIVMIKIITAIKILTFNFLFEKIEYEKSGKCKLLKEKEITKIYDEKQTKKIERAVSIERFICKRK